jgi:UDP-glucose 4-epimerase
MHVLVTGGAGFIGSHIVQFHLALGDRVHIIDNLSTGRRDNLAGLADNPSCHFDEADILTFGDIDEVVCWADRIYHMAAVVGVKRVLDDPVAVLSTNVAGTERVLRAAHRCGWKPQIILASSSEVYGFNPHSPYSETDELVFSSEARLRWAYAVSKLSDEFLGFAYHRRHGANVIMARFFNTIGPKQVGVYGMVVPTFVQQAIAGQPITIFGDGSQTRSFCDVRDTVIALNLLAGNPDAAGQVVNVGDDREISIRALAELVRDRARSRSELRFVSYEQAYGQEFEDIQHRRPNVDRMRALTGYIPEWTLERTIDDLIERARIGIEQRN